MAGEIKFYALTILRPLFKVAEGYMGEKNINDCPAYTINLNATTGQSFMFFLQIKAASIPFKVLGNLRRLR